MPWDLTMTKLGPKRQTSPSPSRFPWYSGSQSWPYTWQSPGILNRGQGPEWSESKMRAGRADNSPLMILLHSSLQGCYRPEKLLLYKVCPLLETILFRPLNFTNGETETQRALRSLQPSHTQTLCGAPGSLGARGQKRPGCRFM